MIKYQKRSISKPMNILSVKNLERFSIKSTLYPILLIIFIHFKSSFFDNRLIVRWGMTKYFIEFPLFKLAKSREISYNVSKDRHHWGSHQRSLQAKAIKISQLFKKLLHTILSKDHPAAAPPPAPQRYFCLFLEVQRFSLVSKRIHFDNSVAIVSTKVKLINNINSIIFRSIISL